MSHLHHRPSVTRFWPPSSLVGIGSVRSRRGTKVPNLTPCQTETYNVILDWLRSAACSRESLANRVPLCRQPDRPHPLPEVMGRALVCTVDPITRQLPHGVVLLQFTAGRPGACELPGRWLFFRWRSQDFLPVRRRREPRADPAAALLDSCKIVRVLRTSALTVRDLRTRILSDGKTRSRGCELSPRLV